MDLILSLPALLRILVVFVTVLFVIRFKIALGSAFLIGTALLGVLFGVPILEILQSALFSFLQLKTLAISSIVCLILVLSHSMDAAGQMQRLLDRFRGLIRHPGLNLIFFPAIIGLLPMPGGAIFSAPMVKSVARDRELSSGVLSYTNYWFRHIWEYWWPLYPGILLGTAMARVDLWMFVLFMFPLTVVAAIAGYWPLRQEIIHQPQTSRAVQPSATGIKPFLAEIFPILLVIVGGLGSGSILAGLPSPYAIPVAKEAGLIAALVAAIWWVWRQNELEAATRKAILRRPELWRMFYMVSGIMIFQGILKDSGAVSAVSRDLIAWEIPLGPICLILPFLVGTVVGLAVAFVGVTFPILVSLIHAYGEGHMMMAYLVLAMVGGFTGVLLSPLHMCLLLSNRYFETDMATVYRKLWPPCLILIVTAALYFIAIRFWTRA